MNDLNVEFRHEIQNISDDKKINSILFGVTDGKAVGTYIEHKFKAYPAQNYEVAFSSPASGINLPELNVDIKVTSISQPQSFCPFKSARQKIFGLGYSLLIFVYSKTDDAVNRTANEVCKLLNSDAAREFFKSFIFWDSKRPITVDVLQKLDIGKLKIFNKTKVQNGAETAFQELEIVHENKLLNSDNQNSFDFKYPGKLIKIANKFR